MDLTWLPELRQQLLGALDPWVQALSTHVRFSIDTTPTTSSLIIDIATDGGVDVRVFEAIELLALLGGVDARLFTVHVYAAATRHSPWLRLPEGTTPSLKCVLRVRHGDDFPTAIITWCERLVLGGVEGTASKEYMQLRMLLESTYQVVDMVSGSSPRLSRAALVVPVEVQVAQGDFEQRVGQLAHVAMMQQARDRMDTRVFQHPHWKPIFRVTEVDPGIPRAITAKAFLYMAQIGSCGIDLSRLWAYNMDVEPETASVFARGLQLLTGTPTNESTVNGTLKEIELPQYMSEQTVSAVFSALMVSQSVEELTINHETMPWQQDIPNTRTMTREQRAHLWKWIGLGLFSRYASHQLNTIRFHVQDLDEHDVAAFRTAFYRPEAAITAAINDELKTLKKLTASRFMLMAPLPSMTTGFYDMQFASQDVLVEDHDGDPQNHDWLRVMLPGCGRAWVHRSCITSSSESQDLGTTPSPSLTIAYMNERSKPAVLELMQLVGRNVQSLYVVNCSTREPLDDWLLSVVAACPRLETLAMANGGSIATMDTIAKMYDHDSCQVNCLRLNDVRVDLPESIPHFFRLLGDDTRRMSKHLQKVSLTAQALGTALVDIVPIIDSVLSSNVKLQDLHMLVSYQAHISAANFATVSSLCQRHRDKPVAVRLAPLSFSQKIAFISSIENDEHSNAQLRHVMRRLDHRVLSLVFQFAAECKKRTVSLWFHTEANAEDDGDDHVLAQLRGEEEVDDPEFEDEVAGGGDNDRED